MSWSEIADFQTLLAGIIGFSGVVATLWYNGKVARDQRRDERRDEREALRAALLEELKINRHSLKENMDSFRQSPPDEGGSAFVPTNPMDDAYRSFVSRIGLLSQVEVSKVMTAYLSLRTYNAKLFLMGVPVATSPRHVQVPANNFPLLAGVQEGLISPIDEAIDVLTKASDAG